MKVATWAEIRRLSELEKLSQRAIARQLGCSRELVKRALVHALEFFGGTPRKVVFDNLKAAVLSGPGQTARLHPEFEALCGHYYLEPIACEDTIQNPREWSMPKWAT